jgi:hypothetical protein
VAVVELPGDEPPVVAPVEQSAANPLGHPVELGGQPAELGEPHPVMLARNGLLASAPRRPGARAAEAAREPAIGCYGQVEAAQVWSASAWA